MIKKKKKKESLKGKNRKAKIKQVWDTSSWLNTQDLPLPFGPASRVHLLQGFPSFSFYSPSGLSVGFWEVALCPCSFLTCRFLLLFSLCTHDLLEVSRRNYVRSIFIAHFVAQELLFHVTQPMGSEDYPVVMASGFMSIFSFFRMVWSMRREIVHRLWNEISELKRFLELSGQRSLILLWSLFYLPI